MAVSSASSVFSRSQKELDAVVVKWIVRGRNDNPGVKAFGAGQVGNAGRGDDTGAAYCAPGLCNPLGNGGSYPRTGFTGVTANDQPGRLPGTRRQHLAERGSDDGQSFWLKWELPGAAAYPIGTRSVP